MSKRDELRARRRSREKRSRIIWIGLAVLLTLGLLAAFVLPPILVMQNIVKITPNPRPQAQGLTMGNPDAAVKVEEFSDFQCPICKDFADNIESQIVSQYVSTGKISFSYTPMAFIGAESVTAAKASYCASEQGKFWEYHDILFANQKAENVGDFSDDRLSGFARSLGINSRDFNSCVVSGRYDDQLKENDTRARDAGITGTPSFLVNGKLIPDYRTLISEIDQALAAPQ